MRAARSNANTDKIAYVNDTFELNLGLINGSFSYCKVFKFTTLLDSVMFFWPILNLLIDGISSLNLSIFYLAMFWKVYLLAKVPDSPDHGKTHPAIIVETMNRIEEYLWLKKVLISVDAFLMILATVLNIFITEAARDKHKGLSYSTIAHALRLFVLWTSYIGQNFIKETMEDILE